MRVRASRKPPRPLDEPALQELAIAYVGRFATTRAKLRAYLARKIRERGWSGQRDADLAGLAERLADQGFVDDAGYAVSKARALTARGYGKRRVTAALLGAGIADQDREEANRHSDSEAVNAALRFAERRRIGPFAVAAPADRKERERAIGAMVRAGHGFPLARAIADMRPGTEIDMETLSGHARLGQV